LEKYKCECEKGYEATSDPEVCTPVMCGQPPMIDHTFTTSQLDKLSYPDTASYTCDVGGTFTGKVDGGITFVVECKADGSFGGQKECKPMECGDLPTVSHGSTKDKALTYKEKATYKCDKGYSVGGDITGTTEFPIECTSSGDYTAPMDCSPILCGMTPRAFNADYKSQEVHFSDAPVAYSCIEGYTLDGEVGGEKEWDVKCLDTGDFEGMKKCKVVTCGMPPEVDNSMAAPAIEFSYGQTLEIFCDEGYTVNTIPSGKSSFRIRCGSDVWGGRSGHRCSECKNLRRRGPDHRNS
jgi:CUB/sushi domain-containing protein